MRDFFNSGILEVTHMANGPRTQDFIPIKEIRDGIVVLQDGSLRAILLASAINIA